MQSAPRIALIGEPREPLAAALSASPLVPEVRCFPTLAGEIRNVQEYRPDVAFVVWSDGMVRESVPHGEPDGERLGERAGAVRVLHGLLPELAVVLVGSVDAEPRLASLAEEVAGLVLLQPFSTTDLGAVLDGALRRTDRPADEVFQDLVRGIADEINNPLLFADGHLQLLAASLDAAGLERLDAARAGLRRIQDTVTKVRMLSRATSGPAVFQPVDVVALWCDFDSDRSTDQPPPTHPPVPGSNGVLAATQTAIVRGDPELLSAAWRDLADLQQALRRAGSQVDVAWTVPRHGVVRGVMTARGDGLAGWQLPRTFEPYAVNRTLRDTAHGLGLFLVRTVVHAHGGQALARRVQTDGLEIELLLPTDSVATS